MTERRDSASVSCASAADSASSARRAGTSVETRAHNVAATRTAPSRVPAATLPVVNASARLPCSDCTVTPAKTDTTGQFSPCC